MHTNNKTLKAISYGSWPSKISSELIVSDSVTLAEPNLTTDALYYIERRPLENGRCVIIKAAEGKSTDLLPAPYSARSKVHEYGGGCYCVVETGSSTEIFFINADDQDIYQLKDQHIRQITHADKLRFADICYDGKQQRLIAICESHESSSITNSIISVDIFSGVITTIEQGNDFYASPRLNSSATKLCWQTWNHPNMPWDGNQLWLADVTDEGDMVNKNLIAGADNISVFQPQWSPDDVLHFVADNNNWWHLYRVTDSNTTVSDDKIIIRQLTSGNREFGLPQWVFAQSTYAFIDNEHIICCYQADGYSQLALLSVSDHSTSKEGNLSDIKTCWQEFSSLSASGRNICFIAASGNDFPQLILANISLDAETTLTPTVIKKSSQLPVPAEYYSQAQSITFLNRHKQNIFAHYYPPVNPDCHAGTAELPPLIVICHGGPTGQSGIALDPKKQFWTSRGFSLLDVNYSGSTGYGRVYRNRLDKKWGELDVDDCCDAALYAVSQGMADKNKLIIRGSSAGGYTVLSALTFRQVFSAGASYYGISELTSLANDTHKFEARYLDRLIGPYPQAREIYDNRSPINHAELLNCPVIFFQGMEDRVVPKQQAEKMFAVLSSKGLPVAAQYYEGEQHGFRKADTIKQSLENELCFYQQVLKLKPESEICFNGDIQVKNI